MCICTLCLSYCTLHVTLSILFRVCARHSIFYVSFTCYYFGRLVCSCLQARELCTSRGLSVITSFVVSVDVKQYWTILTHWSQLVSNMSADIRGHQATPEGMQLPTSIDRLHLCFKNISKRLCVLYLLYDVHHQLLTPSWQLVLSWRQDMTEKA